MERSAYEAEAELEATHWWFEGRRRLFARTLAVAGAPKDAAILDAGSGTGSNLRMLLKEGFSNVVGLDSNPEAIRYCAQKNLPVRQGSLDALPFPDGAFDIVLATDVLEHLDDDRRASKEIARVLKPGGQVLVTVPAFKSLWGPQDVLAHHKRRYLKHEILRIMTDGGFLVREAFYFNYLLFPPIWLGRTLLNALRVHLRSEADLNAPILNRFLLFLFNLDARSAPKIRPPFGVSILLRAERPLGYE